MVSLLLKNIKKLLKKNAKVCFRLVIIRVPAEYSRICKNPNKITSSAKFLKTSLKKSSKKNLTFKKSVIIEMCKQFFFFWIIITKFLLLLLCLNGIYCIQDQSPTLKSKL